MSKTIADFTMSLDGYIAGPGDDVGHLFNWYRLGDTDFHLPGMDRTFRMSAASAALLHERWPKLGAVVTGRRDFDVSRAWGGEPVLGIPTFIVTHHVPPEWAGPDAPFTFVTGGVASAIAQARQAAGERHVGVSGSTIVQQCLQLGLLDEIQIDLAPLLLGDGIRLFDNLATAPIDLEIIDVVPGSGVTHLLYRVVKTET